MGEKIETLVIKGWQVDKINNSLAFALKQNKIAIITPFAAYMVTSSQLNSLAGHARIRRGILNREYQSFADVLTDMKLQPGVGVGYRLARQEEL